MYKNIVEEENRDKRKFITSNLDQDMYQKFLEWLLTNGGKFSKLYLKDYSDNVKFVNYHQDKRSSHILKY